MTELKFRRTFDNKNVAETRLRRYEITKIQGGSHQHHRLKGWLIRVFHPTTGDLISFGSLPTLRDAQAWAAEDAGRQS